MGRLCFHLSSIIVKTAPESVLYCFSRIIGNVVFYAATKRRNRTLENLTFVFENEKPTQEIRRMAKAVFREVAQNVADTAILLLKKKDIVTRLTEDISVEGTEHLDEALKEKKGVICVSAHFGNLMMITPRLSLMGYSCNMIANLADNRIVAEDDFSLERYVVTDTNISAPQNGCTVMFFPFHIEMQV